MTRRVLMLSPHFPPDTRAGAHRVRLLAPHLPAVGWDPVVVTVKPKYYESRLDPELEALVPDSLRIVRASAIRAGLTRPFGMGDMGIRALPFLYSTCRRLLRREHFDALFITTYPFYPALLGRRLRKRFKIPFVVDYQDPWVGAWGRDVGSGPDGQATLKDRVARGAAARLEPRIVGSAAGITAVSRGTWDDVIGRHPQFRDKPFLELPIGGEARDFETVRNDPRPNGVFDPNDGAFHLCYVGTVLPKGIDTLRGFLTALAQVKVRRPDLYARLRVHFIGSSNLTRSDAAARVLPLAAPMGLSECIREAAPRVPYLQALRILTQASAILMMGSSERHYTASKLYPALLARRPLLALYHEASTVSRIVPETIRAPSARMVTYGDDGAGKQVDAIATQLVQLIEEPTWNATDVDSSELEKWSARRLSADLAHFLDSIVTGGGA